MEKLLTRDQFREGVFSRDNHKCVICGSSGPLDAHHILERRLWEDGGYYISNGASLCGEHHIQAETTDLSCGQIREAAGISIVALPRDYYPDMDYSKWGDIILPNGSRMKGPLFHDESVQKILKQGSQLGTYTDYVKYPRTPHLPWSEGQTKDDRTLESCDHFIGKQVVVTEKMDGENTTIYRDYIHARSIDGRDHWSRSRVKNLAGKIGWEIPEGYRICGENLQAKHSIKYHDIPPFMVFSIWNEKNQAISWEETEEICSILELPTVPVLYKGVWDSKLIQSFYNDSVRDTMEGYVVRVVESFNYIDFPKSIAKFVRKNHVDPANHHWMFTASEENGLLKTKV